MQKFSRNRLFSAICAFMLTGILWGAAHGSGAAGNTASQANAVVLPAEARDDTTSTSGAGKDVYGVVNAGPGSASGATINARGQVAFDYYPIGRFGTAVGFFDGERTINVSPPGHLQTSSTRLNDKGDVIWLGMLDDPPSRQSQPFRWSAARGVVQLPILDQDSGTELAGISSRGTIVGWMYGVFSDVNYRALQWTSLNRLVPLSNPAGFTDTWAADINNHDVTIGYGIGPSATSVIVWNANGRPTVLGMFGAGGASARFINDRGEVAGIVSNASFEFTGFLWSQGKGLVRLPGNAIPVALNEAGELACLTEDGTGGTKACLFSRERGLVSLHPARYDYSRTLGLNDSGVIVGVARRNVNQETRAFRWSRRGTGAGTNLNSLLHNPPAGLELRAALGVSANGTILASSNAGLVILRPGGGGTDAPVLGPIQVNPIPFVNDPVPLTLSFRDRNVRETHTATVDWGDGNGPSPAIVREANGRGEVRAQHTYTDDGPVSVVIRVTDSARRTTYVTTDVHVGQPGGFPLLTGGGVLAENASSGVRGMPTVFKLAIPVGRQRHADTPFTFRLDGRVSFTGERLDNVTVDGSTVRVEGTGKFNGRAGYRFAIDARAGALDSGAEAGALSVRITEAGASAPAQRAAFEAGHGAGTGPGMAALTTSVEGRSAIRLIQ